MRRGLAGRYGDRPYLCGHRRGRAAGPPDHPPAAARAARGPDRGHRLQRAGGDRRLCGHGRGRPCRRQCREAAARRPGCSWPSAGTAAAGRRHHGRRARTPRISVDGLDGRTRAFLQVQQGCDHRCTFCIIPYGRGPSRSVPLAEIVAQARALLDGRLCRARGHRGRHRLLRPGSAGPAWAGRDAAPTCWRRCRSCRGCACPRSTRPPSTTTPATWSQMSRACCRTFISPCRRATIWCSSA